MGSKILICPYLYAKKKVSLLIRIQVSSIQNSYYSVLTCILEQSRNKTMGIEFFFPEGLNASPSELRMLFAAKLFEQGLVTSGQGAKIAELSKRAFIEHLGKYKVSVFQSDEEGFNDDVLNA